MGHGSFSFFLISSFFLDFFSYIFISYLGTPLVNKIEDIFAAVECLHFYFYFIFIFIFLNSKH